MWRALALLPAFGGCIFFVDGGPEGASGTCHFKGEATDCGRCISANCQGELDACCEALGLCESALEMVDACASGAPFQTCGFPDGGRGVEVDVISCVKASCWTLCDRDDSFDL